MKKATIQLETLTCPSCIQKIEGLIKSLEGVDMDSLHISFNSSKARFNFDESKININAVEDAIVKLGYEVKKSQVKEI